MTPTSTWTSAPVTAKPDTNQDHPGPEWVWLHEESSLYCPGLNIKVMVGPTEAIEAAYHRCRAISAAALAWEQQKSVASGVCQYLEMIQREIELGRT